ncbi:MAG: dihydroorotase [bacterium]
MSDMILNNCHIVNHDTELKNRTIYIDKDRISAIKEKPDPDGLDMKGMTVLPGLIDMHVHLREPGEEHKEDILSGSRAAAKGGFTGICLMPNTKPPADTPQAISFLMKRANETDIVDIYPFGALTKKLESNEITEIYDMIKAGARGFSDDGEGTSSSKILFNAAKYCLRDDILITTHCEDKAFTEGGQINDSRIALETGLKGIPHIDEDIIVYRNLSIASYLGSRMHIAHVSSSHSLDIIENFKNRGDNVTCEVTPHHLLFNDGVYKNFDTNYKVKPPLRTENDRKALISALKNGIIDIIATDHAPHQIYEKEVEFEAAPFGILGLETALVSLYTYLIKDNTLSFRDIARSMAYNPSRILGIEEHYIKEGAYADITVFNTDANTSIDRDFISSKSFNTPFKDKTLDGRIELTIRKGRIVYEAE